MILVSTGTSEYEFDRLFKILEKFCENGILNGKNLIVQLGNSKFQTNKFKCFSMLSNDEYNRLVDDSEFIISHAGTGSVVPALKKNKKIIVFPRLSEYNEHIDNHQLELANLFASKNYVLCAKNEKELEEAIKNIKNFKPNRYVSNNEKINKIILDFIEKI